VHHPHSEPSRGAVKLRHKVGLWGIPKKKRGGGRKNCVGVMRGNFTAPVLKKKVLRIQSKKKKVGTHLKSYRGLSRKVPRGNRRSFGRNFPQGRRGELRERSRTGVSLGGATSGSSQKRDGKRRGTRRVGGSKDFSRWEKLCSGVEGGCGKRGRNKEMKVHYRESEKRPQRDFITRIKKKKP